MADLTYRGVLLADLPVEEVDWTGREDHVRYRSRRLRDPDEFNVEPEWATEAAMDPDRLGKECESGSLELIGWSPNATGRVCGRRGRILRVWVRPATTDVMSGRWKGRSACLAPEFLAKTYCQSAGWR